MERNWAMLSDLDFWIYWLHRYADLGPLPGILLPLMEAFIPVLPLFAIVMGNAAAYGLWTGLLLSWIGTTLGSVLVFFLFRMLGGRRLKEMLARHPKARTFFDWVERKGFTPILLIYAVPFTPSALVNVAAGLSTIPVRKYLWATALGKGMMVLTMSFLGHDLYALIRQPWRLALACLILGLLWGGSKLIERKYFKTSVEGQ